MIALVEWSAAESIMLEMTGGWQGGRRRWKAQDEWSEVVYGAVGVNRCPPNQDVPKRLRSVLASSG